MTDEELMKKIENQVSKKTHGSHKKRKPKKKENAYKLYERLQLEELIRLGYIKNN